MKNLLDNVVQIMSIDSRVNYRDRRGHYASSNQSCLRDQYWSWTGEPITNPTDLKGAMKMMVGNAVEDGIVKHILNKLYATGVQVIGTQVPVGGSNPDWNGYLDALCARKTDSGWDKFVIEIKTKSGYGADLFYRNPEPAPGYMIQLGLYLKDLSEKGITDHGCFLYLLMSDKNFGEVVTVDCHYDKETNSIEADGFRCSDGRSGSLSLSEDLGKALERWQNLNECIATKTLPPGEYKYKHELTREFMDTLSDAKLKKIIDGSVIGGDWQPLYSRYKNKGLEVDGIVPERSAEEISVARAEYKRRHPRSKI